MTKHEVFNIIRDNVLTILPDLTPDAVTIDGRMKDLGANSIDRMEIVTKSMEDLVVQVPLVELGGVSNIRGLVDLLYERKSA